MFERYQRDRGATASRRRLLVIGTTLAGAVFAFAYAARGAKSHEALTKVELEKIVAAMDVNPDVKIEVTDGVLRRVNRYITEPGRNADLKDALERMAKHKPMISSYLEKYDLPTELLAVPMIESGYENLDQATWDKRVKSGEVAGAGLWMFIKPSARDYGLVVDSTRDQRLDPPLETDAAMRLLAANKLRFKDWMLSLAAYNQGEGVVQKAIDQGGTRDAWTLSQKGLLNDYITFFSTAVILINNPQLLD